MNTGILQIISLFLLVLALSFNLTLPSQRPLCPDLARKKMQPPRELLKYENLSGTGWKK